MTDMRGDPTTMTPSQRRYEVATILARGVFRLRQCRENTQSSRPSCTAGKASESGRDRLDEGGEHEAIVDEDVFGHGGRRRPTFPRHCKGLPRVQ